MAMSKMERAFVLLLMLGFGLIIKCSAATVHTVGDSSGWDISTDLDSWGSTKAFLVGDVLLFQYSSYHSVEEVTKPNYEGCNKTNVLQASSNGNTTFALTDPGDRYFICGNRLHCLGGMKLHVHVQEDKAAVSPARAPAAESGANLPPGSTKSNTPLSSGAVKFSNNVGVDCVVFAMALFLSAIF